MKIGVFLTTNLRVGGGFQQAYSVVKLLRDNPLRGIEYVFFVSSRENEKILRDEGLCAVRVSFASLFSRIRSKLIRILIGYVLPFYPDFPFFRKIDKFLDRHKIDLVYFLDPSSYAMSLRRHNYIITVWDQCHRDYMEFPEVYSNLEFERRESFCRCALPKAAAVLVDAEASRKTMHERYGVDLERIHVAPFFPIEEQNTGDEPDVCQKYSIVHPFVFYPAQFWAHKNHVYILDALSRLNGKGVKVAAVFVGNDYGNRSFLVEQSQKMGLADQVHFLGFIPRAELTSFYKKALALVMPTYLGPTNIPPLEAFALKCPVCYPDLPGLREQVAGGAFLMDLNDPESLCNIINTLLSDEREVARKISAGTERLEFYSEQNYMRVLERLFQSYSNLMRCRSDFTV